MGLLDLTNLILIIMRNKKFMTNEVGAPVKDNRNSLTAGERGPMLLEDLWMMGRWRISTVR